MALHVLLPGPAYFRVFADPDSGVTWSKSSQLCICSNHGWVITTILHVTLLLT